MASRTHHKAEVIKELQTLRNIGPAIAGKLYLAGVRSSREIRQSDPEVLYAKMQKKLGPLDRCVLYTLHGAKHNKPWPECADNRLAQNTGGFDKELKKVRAALKASGSPERAEKEKQYLKSPYKFFGASVPVIERVAKGIKKEHPRLGRKRLFSLAQTLWASEYHEEKSVAVKLLCQYPEHLDMGAMPLLERMLSQCVGWDHTDWISIHLVGEVLAKDKKAYDYLRKWSRHGNRWMRRAAIISQILLFRTGRGDRRLFFSLARRMAPEKEFFIRKAIGWTVRELSKADPRAAYDFLMEIKGTASGLTLREGSRLMPDEMKRQVTAR